MSTFYSKASTQTSEVFSLPACFIAFIPLCLTETYQIDIQCGVPRCLINLPKCLFFYSVHGAQSLLYESHMRNTQTQLFFLCKKTKTLASCRHWSLARKHQSWGRESNNMTVTHRWPATLADSKAYWWSFEPPLCKSQSSSYMPWSRYCERILLLLLLCPASIAIQSPQHGSDCTLQTVNPSLHYSTGAETWFKT